MRNELKEQINKLGIQINKLVYKRDILKKQLAELQSEFKIGDLLTIEGGKDNAVYVLTNIRPGYGDTPKYFGQKIKKDGTPGARISQINVWCEQKIVKAS